MRKVPYTKMTTRFVTDSSVRVSKLSQHFFEGGPRFAAIFDSQVSLLRREHSQAKGGHKRVEGQDYLVRKEQDRISL